MNGYARRLEVDHVILLNYNPFQLAFVFFEPLYAVSGILFLQFYRMSTDNWKSKLKYYKKYYLSKFYSHNASLRSVCVLNDQESVNFLNNEFVTSIFRMLKDPIPELSPLKDFDIYKHYGIEKKRMIFLHIGALGDRKGTFDVIESINHLDDKIKQKVAILLVGMPESEIVKKDLLNSISSHNKQNGELLYYDFNFISNQKMKSVFDQSYSVLIPYKNSEASSGILGHSIAAKKPVIATGSGLIKEIIEMNNLGLLIKDNVVISLARNMEKLVESESTYVRFSGSEKFVKSHRPTTFVESILAFSNEI
jgi:glycosyltransferase involved in cell wall biosynthesis